MTEFFRTLRALLGWPEDPNLTPAQAQRARALAEKARVQPFQNPHAYDLEPHAQVDPALIRYQEKTGYSLDLAEPASLTIHPDGSLWVAGAGAVARIDPHGGPARTLAVPGRLAVAHCQDERHLWLASDREIWRVDLPGAHLEKWLALEPEALITGLAAQPGRLYVADAGRKAVRCLDAQGRELPGMGRDFLVPSPYFDLSPGPDGSLWAANPGHRRLEQYSAQGRLLRSWGHASIQIDGFCGCCNPCHFVALPGGGFLTAEKGLPRVKLYDASGVLAAVVAPPGDFADRTPWLDVAAVNEEVVYVLDPKMMKVRVYGRI